MNVVRTVDSVLIREASFIHGTFIERFHCTCFGAPVQLLTCVFSPRTSLHFQPGTLPHGLCWPPVQNVMKESGRVGTTSSRQGRCVRVSVCACMLDCDVLV